MLELTGTLTTADFARFQYFHLLRRAWPVPVFIFLITAIGIAAVIARPDPNLISNVRPMLILSLVWILLIFVSPYWSARKQLSRQPYLRGVVAYGFTPEGIDSQLTSVSSKMAWSVIQKIGTTKSLFLLYYAPNMALILPRRFFLNDSQLAEWLAMIPKSIAPLNPSKTSLIGRFL